MIYGKKILLSFVCSSLFLCYAQNSNADGSAYSYRGVELKLGGGFLSGGSGEYVYDAYGDFTGIPGYKISQLDWSIDNVYMVGISATFTPASRFRINVDYWRDAVDGDATMDDYDWLYAAPGWSHWSHTEDTTVTEVSNANINAEISFVKFRKDQTDLTALIGYKRDHFKWVGVGGYGVYSINSYRDANIILPDIPVITYEQNYSTPYIGIGVNSTSETSNTPITLRANILYSRWVRGDDEDTHHLRDLNFVEAGDKGVFLGYNLDIDFYLTQKLALSLGYSQQNYKEIKATTTITDLSTGAIYYYPGPSAGLDNSTSMLTARMTYRF